LRQSIKVSRQWIAKQAALKKDTTTLKTLKGLEAGDTTVCKRELDCFMTQYGLLNKYGGALFTKENEDKIAKAETYYADYDLNVVRQNTIPEKIPNIIVEISFQPKLKQ
jgi:hypothetical protein